uniref:Uncharacterized protein n=1 Tax=Branchiostoma floridae TaxID=7739 RepID=C3YS45_BRAFL|eukprot:XP_002600938.1 hypothetical protein BRAFLDRAFT_79128 [Branchiostoma floridae]
MTIVTTEDATATDLDLETRVFPQIGTAKAVMSETTTKVLAQYVERTGFDQLQKTTKQQILTTRKGCPTVVLYGSTTLQVSRMTSYKMTGDTREGRPVYYSHATCEFLYYKCGDYLKWCVGRWVGSKYRSINVRDSHLYADEINETFFLWDGRQWIGNTDVKIACSVPQPESNAKDCPRVRLQGDATYQPSRMTTYTRTNQTSGGRPVYVSDTDSRDFLFFFGERNQWWVGRTIGKDNGGAHIGDCAMTPDQTRPLWELWDGGVWRFVPSVHATCVGMYTVLKHVVTPRKGGPPPDGRF